MNKLRIKIVLLVTSITLLLTSCWIPENFEVSININQNGSYEFIYDGTLTFALALAAKDGDLSEKDELGFKKEEDNLIKEDGFKEVKYLGKGRYKVLVEKTGVPGERYDFIAKDMKFFSIIPQQDGSIKVTAAKFSKKELHEIESIGAKINGTLSVSAGEGVSVIKHNAQSEPTLLGYWGDYEWKINTVDSEPFIILQPSS